MKYLTQAIFNGQEFYKLSAAINENGDAYFHNLETALLDTYRLDAGLGMWDLHHMAHESGHMTYFIGSGYDTTDWQNSAIDRELSA